MPQHYVDRFGFELWKGDVPGRYTQQLETFTRAGVDGIAAKLTGRRGSAFTCELTSWSASFGASRAAWTDYLVLIGGDPVEVVHNGFRFFALYKLKFLVEDVREVDCRANVRLLGPGINYAGGSALTTRWTMTPILVN